MFSHAIYVLLLINLFSVSAIPPLQILGEHQGSALTDLNGDLHKQFRVPSDPRFRLPENVMPTDYFIRMIPILEEEPSLGEIWTAPSHVTIYVDCIEQATSITLHSNVRTIDESSVTVTNRASNQSVTIASHSYDSEKQFYIISLQVPLVAGQQYSISIDYVALVALDRLDGLYRSHYIDPTTGSTKYLAATQFQAYGARSAFPSFDEPSFKARFTMVLGRKENYNALWNTPLERTTQHETLPNWFYDHFEEVVPMSTCIMAILISDYGAAAAPIGQYFDKPVQTILPQYLIDQGAGDYASIIAAKDLAYFEEVFHEKYSLPKMDSAGIIDFAAGAMENWGLNLYRELYLYYLEGESTEADKRRTGEIIAHELAHQWFGNLVTCKWWTGAWLNEGHASYVQYLGLYHTNPEFESLKSLQTDAKQHAMRADALESSHPTVIPDKGNPYDTMSYQGALVYQKGAAVIKMMEGFLSFDTLIRGYREYLRIYSFLSTEQDDLFEVMQDIAMQDDALNTNATMKQIMDGYTLVRGYPLVRVSRASSSYILVSQELFKNADSQWGDPEFFWHIPVAVSTEGNPDPVNTKPDFWLNGVAAVIQPYNTSGWVLLNSGATGYYRVLYDAILTGHLQRQLEENHLLIDDGSRSQIIDDYFTFAFQNYNTMNAALDFTKYLGRETEHYVWVPVFFHLRRFYTLSRGTDDFDRFSEYLSPKLGEVLGRIGLEQLPTHTGLNVMFRTSLLDWACAMGNTDCVQYALRIYDQWKASPATNPIPQDLRPVIYCSAIRFGNSENFNFALNRYQAATIPRQKSMNLASLGCSDDPATLRMFLDLTIDSPSIIRREDVSAAILSVAANTAGRSISLQFFRERINEIIDYYGSPTIVSSFVSTLANSFGSAEQHADVQSFIDDHRELLTPVQASLNSSMLRIRDNMDWRASHGVNIANWLRVNSNSL